MVILERIWQYSAIINAYICYDPAILLLSLTAHMLQTLRESAIGQQGGVFENVHHSVCGNGELEATQVLITVGTNE